MAIIIEDTFGSGSTTLEGRTPDTTDNGETWDVLGDGTWTIETGDSRVYPDAYGTGNTYFCPVVIEAGNADATIVARVSDNGLGATRGIGVCFRTSDDESGFKAVIESNDDTFRLVKYAGSDSEVVLDSEGSLGLSQNTQYDITVTLSGNSITAVLETTGGSEISSLSDTDSYNNTVTTHGFCSERNSDAFHDARVYSISIDAVTVTPELSVDTDNNTDITEGGTVDEDFNQNLGDGNESTEGIVTVTIENVHANDITFGTCTVTGDGTILSQPASSTLANSETTTFTFQFDTTAVADDYSADISIPYTGTGVSNSPFTFTVDSTLTDTGAGTYYVDYENGDDDESGRTTAKAFKHDPHDANATGVSDSRTPAAGATINFAMDVVHKVNITCASGGTSGNRLKRIGNDTAAWSGSANAILDGSTDVTGWEACTNIGDALGSPDHADCWKATISGVNNLGAHAYEGQTILEQARSPVIGASTDKHYIDEQASMTEISDYADIVVTGGGADTWEITSTAFSSLSSTWHQDGEPYLQVYCYPNVVIHAPITAFDDGTDTVTIDVSIDAPDSGSVRPYELADGALNAFAIFNSGHVLTSDNDYVIDATANKIVMKSTSGEPSGITVCAPKHGIHLGGQDHLEFEGFTIRKYARGHGDFGIGAIGNTSGAGSDTVVFNDIHITECRHIQTTRGAFNIFEVDNLDMDEVDVDYIVRGRGISISNSDDGTVDDCEISYTGHTGFTMFGCDTQTATNITVHDVISIHGNGMTFYTSNQDIVVDGARVWDANTACSIDSITNFTLQRSYLETDGARTFTGLAGGGSGVKLYNNVILGENGVTNLNIDFSGTWSTGLVVRNNYLDGYGDWNIGTHSHNTYRKLHSSQTGASWDSHVAANNIEFETDAADVFVDLANRDFTAVNGSSIVDSGIDVGLAFSGSAPNRNLTEDEAAGVVASHYVDGETGDDSTGDGSSTSPYATIAKAITEHGAGDTIYLRGAQTYTPTAEIILASGATLRGWLDINMALPVIDATNVSNVNGGAIYLDNKGATTLQDFKLTDSPQRGIYYAQGSNGAVASNVWVEDSGLGGFDCKNDATGTLTWNYCTSKGATNGDGFDQRGAAIVNCRHCVSDSNAGASSDGFSSHDTGAINIYDCVSINDVDGVHTTGSGTHTINGLIVESCSASVCNIHTGDATVERVVGSTSGTSAFLVQNSSTTTFKNCLAVIEEVDTGSSQGFYLASSGTAMNVYNCGVLSFSTASGTNFRAYRENKAGGMTMKNCWSYLSGASHHHVYSPNDITSDYNAFYPATGNRFYDGTARDFSGWQSNTSQDANSVTGDLGMRHIRTSTLNFGGVTPRSGSILIGAGDDLSGTFTIDAKGRTRVSWDIGPVEFQRSDFMRLVSGG